MKTALTFILTAALYSFSFGQIEFKTDDTEFDANLNGVNDKAKLDIKLFDKNLSIEYGVPEKKIEELHTVKMEPAEIFMAFELAKLSKKSVDDVVNVYKTDKAKGWGYIAKQMGIKPGSKEFHALKDASKKHGNGKKPEKQKSKGKSNGKGKGK